MTDTQKEIVIVCDQIKDLLLEKNRKYGDSAINPIRIFSKADNIEQIKVRIDDKLNRLKNLQVDESEDTVTDLIGYLILYKIAQKNIEFRKETINKIETHWSKL
jgi:hypothetical protein